MSVAVWKVSIHEELDEQLQLLRLNTQTSQSSSQQSAGGGDVHSDSILQQLAKWIHAAIDTQVTKIKTGRQKQRDMLIGIRGRDRQAQSGRRVGSGSES